MQVYIAYLLIISIQALLFFNKKGHSRKDNNIEIENKKKRRDFLILSCIELIILAGLRGINIGADTGRYIEALEYYKGISFYQIFTMPLVYPFDFEIGYFLLSKFCSFLQCSPTVFLFIIACLIYIPVFIYIYNNTKHVYISILVYFAFGIFSYSLGIFRQMIALGIILVALKYIEQNKPIKYFITIIIASLIHTTSLIALILYVLAKINWKKYIGLIFLLEAILMIFGRQVIELAILILPEYSGYIGSVHGGQGGSYLNLIFLNLVMFLYHIVLKNDASNTLKMNIIYSQLIMSVLLQCCGYKMAIFGRLVPYFSISLLIVIPYIVHKLIINDKKERVLCNLILICSLIVLTIITIGRNSSIYPYEFFM